MIASAARAIGHAVQQFDKMIVSSAALGSIATLVVCCSLVVLGACYLSVRLHRFYASKLALNCTRTTNTLRRLLTRVQTSSQRTITTTAHCIASQRTRHTLVRPHGLHNTAVHSVAVLKPAVASSPVLPGTVCANMLSLTVMLSLGVMLTLLV
eukprot:8179-Heterococcus_DN1.PRE.3